MSASKNNTIDDVISTLPTESGSQFLNKVVDIYNTTGSIS